MCAWVCCGVGEDACVYVYVSVVMCVLLRLVCVDMFMYVHSMCVMCVIMCLCVNVCVSACVCFQCMIFSSFSQPLDT